MILSSSFIDVPVKAVIWKTIISVPTFKPLWFSLGATQLFNSTDVPAPCRLALYIKCLNRARRGGPHIDSLTIGGKCL